MQMLNCSLFCQVVTKYFNIIPKLCVHEEKFGVCYNLTIKTLEVMFLKLWYNLTIKIIAKLFF